MITPHFNEVCVLCPQTCTQCRDQETFFKHLFITSFPALNWQKKGNT